MTQLTASFSGGSAVATSIVIVTYNSSSFLDRCLLPIYGQDGIEIVIVDNQSKDNTVDIIKSRYPSVKLLIPDVNLGFAGGNNLAFSHCNSEFILLLNPDAFLEDLSQVDALQKRLEAEPKIAMVAPRLNNVDGSHQTGDAGWRDTISATAGHFLFLHRLYAKLPSLYISHPALLRRDAVEVDWVCGACLMTRKSVIEQIGGLDDRIFMYGEDVEWGERAKNAGRRVVYAPSIEVLHLQGATQRDQAALFFSTKWIDNRATKWAQRSIPKFIAFQSLCVTGFLLRALILSAAAVLDGRKHTRSKAAAMQKYAAHVLKWRSKDLAREPVM